MVMSPRRPVTMKTTASVNVAAVAAVAAAVVTVATSGVTRVALPRVRAQPAIAATAPRLRVDRAGLFACAPMVTVRVVRADRVGLAAPAGIAGRVRVVFRAIVRVDRVVPAVLAVDRVVLAVAAPAADRVRLLRWIRMN